MRPPILLCLVYTLFLFASCSKTEKKTFLSSPVDTINYEIPYTPQVDNIFIHSDESEWEMSVAFPLTLDVIYHYKKGQPIAADTTKLSGIIPSSAFNLFFVKNGDVYIHDKSNRVWRINIKSKEIDTLPLPNFPDYEEVEYWRAYEVQDIMYNDSCALLTPYFIFHLNGRFTEDSARSWNYRSYSGYYFAKLCLIDRDSFQVELLLDNVRNRYIDWNELAPKVPKYDIGPTQILIPTAYHNWIYIIDREKWVVQDSFILSSSFTEQAIKRPPIDFDQRFDTQPYNGPYVRWARQFRKNSGDLQYVVGIDWPSEQGAAYLIQLYNSKFELQEEEILKGNYRHIAYAFFKDQLLYVPVESEEHLMYEVYRLDY